MISSFQDVDPGLGDGGLVRLTDVARDADPRVIGVAPVERDDRLVVVVVDLGQVAQLLVAEVIDRPLEAQVARRRG